MRCTTSSTRAALRFTQGNSRQPVLFASPTSGICNRPISICSLPISAPFCSRGQSPSPLEPTYTPPLPESASQNHALESAYQRRAARVHHGGAPRAFRPHRGGGRLSRHLGERALHLVGP